MAMEKRGRVVLRGAFPAGAVVRLEVRTGDWYAAGKAVKRARVSARGDVEFKGLPAGGLFWVVGEVDGVPRARAVTAKVPVTRPGSPVVAPQLGSSQSVAPGHSTARQVVTGARGSRSAQGHVPPAEPMVDRTAGIPLEGGTPEGEAPRQEDVSGPQMSSTFTGEATPVQDPPRRQDELPEGVPQASATELGVATPVEDSAAEKAKPAKRKPPRKRAPKKVAAKKTAAKKKPAAKPAQRKR